MIILEFCFINFEKKKKDKQAKNEKRVAQLYSGNTGNY